MRYLESGLVDRPLSEQQQIQIEHPRAPAFAVPTAPRLQFYRQEFVQ